jgi:hypothetical protein
MIIESFKFHLRARNLSPTTIKATEVAEQFQRTQTHSSVTVNELSKQQTLAHTLFSDREREVGILMN